MVNAIHPELLRRSHGTELEAVAAEGEWRGAVASGVDSVV